MKLDYLFSVKPDEFIEQLKFQRKSDFLSLSVARELDNAACTIVDARRKLERLTLYMFAQLQYHLGDKVDFTSPLSFNKGDFTIHIQFKKNIDLGSLNHFLTTSSIVVEENSIKIKKFSDEMPFTKAYTFVHKLKTEINTNAVSMPLMADRGLYSRPITTVKPSSTAAVHLAHKAKL